MELPKAEIEISDAKAASVLIVFDEPHLREYFRFNLSSRGFEVLSSKSCPEVLALIDTAKPDLIILDLKVSGLDGFERCHKICKENRSSMIIFNMYSYESDLLRSLQMGVDDYLGKPLGVDELMARVRSVLHRRHSDDSLFAENISTIFELSKI